MSAALLRIEGLSLRAHQGLILRHLTLEVHPGEIVALTGRSGSGKTSVALAILGLLPKDINIDSGSIHWIPPEGEIMAWPADAGKWPSLRGTHIGYTQQDAYGAFDPVMPLGKQMLMLIRERSSTSGSNLEHDLRTTMEEVGLHDIDRLLSSYPHQLSGGQLQRCQIAMAVVMRPRLLITDEPTSAIDRINQVEMLDVLSMIRSKYNVAILCISHEEAVVRHLADREVAIGELAHVDASSDLPVLLNQGVTAEPVIEARALSYTHHYGGMAYAKGASVGPLDFKVLEGQCLGVVGESGSGKSTLAQLLVGLYVPRRGQLFFHGRLLDFSMGEDVRLLRNKVQLVMQDGRGSLHPYKSVRILLQEVRTGSDNKEAIWEEEWIRVLEEVGLSASVLDRRAPQLSGGECLRVSIARALLMRPALLICDESTSALDGATRDAIVALLQDLMERHRMALIFISHDDRIIRSISRQVLVLANGQVVEQGPAHDVILYPTHPVTRKIFSSHATLKERRRLSD